MPYYGPSTGGSGGQTWKTDETAVESANGVRTTFTVPHSDTYIASCIQVFLNGQSQTHGGDFSEASSSTITFVTAPLTGDIIRLNYRTT